MPTDVRNNYRRECRCEYLSPGRVADTEPAGSRGAADRSGGFKRACVSARCRRDVVSSNARLYPKRRKTRAYAYCKLHCKLHA
jgi:hypothetical protein